MQYFQVGERPIMELQLVSAMLVILFFILYREQRKARRETSEKLRQEVNSLQQSLVAIDDRICSLSENVVVVYGRPDKSILKDDSDALNMPRSDETVVKASD